MAAIIISIMTIFYYSYYDYSHIYPQLQARSHFISKTLKTWAQLSSSFEASL